eukprot:Blabericola_migrator_1__1659@NODE_1445_length_4532_cov_230_960806_g958_i0_p2_GENE_NODE_1445_length_4532_cov_230_960806_g958_i0NODE_1445_length_4532_cov_230_960806_g958_i0_p2_ORF_typecomplete_len241_score12_17EFhand_11/PF08976_11/1_5e10EFhand_7/PF13499_6/7_4e03EFhand_7/PF13499_6/2_1e05EFhand_6/PF13405_6/0_0013DUF4667/PF15700_5/0_0024EFhand_9/PF14658_6/1_2e04EFhand_9/PF14658_6/0_015WHAMMJMY_N/PF15920_5/1_6e02WHAMMJMY_N/PF15920_5/0_43EFhand_8/PF13833_6/2_1EFhand_8/PF13833_6/78Chorion_2/PF03964_15/0
MILLPSGIRDPDSWVKIKVYAFPFASRNYIPFIFGEEHFLINAMALICRGILRDLFHLRDHSYDYGLWMPKDQYRASSMGRSSSSSSSSSTSSSSSSSSSRKASPVQSGFEKAWNSVAGKRSTVTCHEAVSIVRQLGCAPSVNDIDQLKMAHGDNITRENASNFGRQVWRNDNVDSLIALFKHFDITNSGTVSNRQLRNILCTYGEPMQSKEVDALLRTLGMETAPTIDYRAFLTALCEP